MNCKQILLYPEMNVITLNIILLIINIILSFKNQEISGFYRTKQDSYKHMIPNILPSMDADATKFFRYYVHTKFALKYLSTLFPCYPHIWSLLQCVLILLWFQSGSAILSKQYHTEILLHGKYIFSASNIVL
eukprot:119636_1